MTYNYEAEKPYVMSDAGQRELLAMLDRAREHASLSGATTTFALMRRMTGSSWEMLAIIDRLVECGYLREVGAGWRSDDKVYVVKEAAR